MTDNPKFCECGCGHVTPLVKKTKRSIGHVRGQSLRFILGHNGSCRSEAAQERVSQALSRRIRDRNPMWRGGVKIDRGRRRIKVGRDHPMADSNGYCAEHRLVLAGVLGRWLSRDELVHHVDLDPSNNEPENLVLVTRAQHREIHNLIRAGSVPVTALGVVLGATK